MNKIFYVIAAALMFCCPSLNAQDMGGMDFGPQRGETAFAYGCTPLNELPHPTDPSRNLTDRWGWQLCGEDSCPNHPNDIIMTAPIYASAAQNDITKGTHVGNLYYYIDNGMVVATYMMFEGYIMTETHLYAGWKNTETAAPGEFGHQHTNLNSSYDQYVVFLRTPAIRSWKPSDPVYIVAHAVVIKAN